MQKHQENKFSFWVRKKPEISFYGAILGKVLCIYAIVSKYPIVINNSQVERSLEDATAK